MLEHQIQQHFINSADLKYQSAQILNKPIALAVQAVLACVTSGGRVLVCGHGFAAAQAQQFAAAFIGRFERERPELSAFALTSNVAILTSLAHDQEPHQIFARQVRALGQSGDLLFIIHAHGNASDLLAAVSAAHEREMSVVALTGQNDANIGASLCDTDIHIAVPHDRIARIQEVHMLALHCICDGVDSQLLGEQET